MVYGATPFANVPNHIKYSAIADPNFRIEFPLVCKITGPNGVATTPLHSMLRDVLQACLRYEPKQRPTVDGLLSHEFLYPLSSPSPPLRVAVTAAARAPHKLPLPPSPIPPLPPSQPLQVPRRQTVSTITPPPRLASTHA